MDVSPPISHSPRGQMPCPFTSSPQATGHLIGRRLGIGLVLAKWTWLGFPLLEMKNTWGDVPLKEG